MAMHVSGNDRHTTTHDDGDDRQIAGARGNGDVGQVDGLRGECDDGQIVALAMTTHSKGNNR